MANLEERVAHLEGWVEGVSPRLDRIEQRIEDLSGRIDHLDQKIDSVRTELSDRIATLETKFDRFTYLLIAVLVGVIAQILMNY
jgi:tetrahydromethanopterin S-methyltransferase subunit G